MEYTFAEIFDTITEGQIHNSTASVFETKLTKHVWGYLETGQQVLATCSDGDDPALKLWMVNGNPDQNIHHSRQKWVLVHYLSGQCKCILKKSYN